MFTYRDFPDGTQGHDGFIYFLKEYFCLYGLVFSQNIFQIGIGQRIPFLQPIQMYWLLCLFFKTVILFIKKNAKKSQNHNLEFFVGSDEQPNCILKYQSECILHLAPFKKY